MLIHHAAASALRRTVLLRAFGVSLSAIVFLSVAAGTLRGAPTVAVSQRPITAREKTEASHRFENAIPIELDLIDLLGSPADQGPQGSTAGGGECPGPLTASHTGANFEGGTFVIQAGFAEGEIAAVSYTLPPEVFPIVIRSVEGVFAQDAVVETTTQWSLLIWEGAPNGIRVFEIRSDDDPQLQPLIMQPGRRGTNLLVSIDPSDQDQIVIEDTLGTHTFSVGYRIDQHNNQTGDPCVPPPSTQNAFPTTDHDGLSTTTKNWLSAINCGPTGCPAGWRKFSELGQCQPSGDWVIRATYECTPRIFNGACCRRDASCQNNMTNQLCSDIGGTFMGEAVRCENVTCPPPVGACCISGNCLPDVEAATCASIPDSAWAGPASVCEELPCQFVACCKPDGSCSDEMEIVCRALDGLPRFDTTCAQASCPQPRGACCVGNVCVSSQTNAACSAVGVWLGPNTTCSPAACHPGACLAGTMLDAVPPADLVDARRPHPTDDASLSAREGIGGAQEPITLALSRSGAADDCFDVCETAIDPDFGANLVAGVVEEPAGHYRLTLARPLTAGAVTRILYEGGSSALYTFHPGNANGDDVADAQDVLQLVEYLNGSTVAPYGPFSTDIDHSGASNPADVAAIIDVLNGAGLLGAWNSAPRPINSTCP